MQRYKDGAKMRLEGAEKLVVQVRGDKSQKWGNKDEGVSLELKTDEAVSWELRVHLVVVEEEELMLLLRLLFGHLEREDQIIFIEYL